MRVTIVHNPSAGQSDHGPSLDEVVQAYEGAGHEVRCYEAGGAAFSSCTSPGDLLVVIGGDGTIGSVLKALEDRSVPIAIVPAGTANNVARSLGLPLGEALPPLPPPERCRSIELFRAEGPWGERELLESAGIGPLAEAMRETAETEPEPADEIAHARALAARALKGPEPLALSVEIDGDDLGNGHVMVEVLNIPFIGPNLPLAPDAAPDDGLLDVVMASADEAAAIAAWIEGGMAGPPPVRVRRARKLRLFWGGGDGTCLRLDDEFMDLSSPTDVTLQPCGNGFSIVSPEDGS